MIIEYSVNIKIDKPVYESGLMDELGHKPLEGRNVRISVGRDGNTKFIKSMYAESSNVESIELSQEEADSGITKAQKHAEAIYDAHNSALSLQAMTAKLYTEKIVGDAMDFGMNLAKEFAAENVRLGISQAGMTRIVRQKLADLFNALQTGSLKDAIEVAKETPAEDKDATFITDARLLLLVNKLEDYLGLPKSSSL